MSTYGIFQVSLSLIHKQVPGFKAVNLIVLLLLLKLGHRIIEPKALFRSIDANMIMFVCCLIL